MLKTFLLQLIVPPLLILGTVFMAGLEIGFKNLNRNDWCITKRLIILGYTTIIIVDIFSYLLTILKL